MNRETHEAELKTMNRLFADVKTTDEIVAMLADAGACVLSSRSAAESD